MKKIIFFTSLVMLPSFSFAAPFTQAPAVGDAPSAAVLYTFNSNGTITTQVDPTIPSTDGFEDTLAAVQNNSGHTINSLSLSGVGINGEGIFNFDGDGQSTIANPGSGPGDSYFGQYFDSAGSVIGTTTFSGISVNGDSGTINFAGMPNGGYGWFVLEDQINFGAPPPPIPEPETYAMLLAGLGLLGWRMRRA